MNHLHTKPTPHYRNNILEQMKENKTRSTAVIQTQKASNNMNTEYRVQSLKQHQHCKTALTNHYPAASSDSLELRDTDLPMGNRMFCIVLEPANLFLHSPPCVPSCHFLCLAWCSERRSAMDPQGQCWRWQLVSFGVSEPQGRDRPSAVRSPVAHYIENEWITVQTSISHLISAVWKAC